MMQESELILYKALQEIGRIPPWIQKEVTLGDRVLTMAPDVPVEVAQAIARTALDDWYNAHARSAESQLYPRMMLDDVQC